MQGLATSTGRVSPSFLVPRIQSPFLKHLKPRIVCFSNVGSFPKSKISRLIVPLQANDLASSSSFTHIFALDRRIPRRVRASIDENSITPVAANRLQNRLFMVYCCLGFMWLVKNEFLPHYFRFHMTMGLLLDAPEFFPWINISSGRMRMYYMILAMGFSCALILVDILWSAVPRITLCFAGVAFLFKQLARFLGLS